MLLFEDKIRKYAIPDENPTIVGVHPKIVLVHPKLSPDADAFLTKMIIAFQWPIEKCFHLEVDPLHAYDQSLLWNQNQLQLVWLFDIEPSDIGIFILAPKYKILEVNELTVYVSDTLEKLDSRKELKLKVWNDLKPLKITEES